MEIDNQLKDIKFVADHLKTLCNAFDITGNIMVADKLLHFSQVLDRVEREIRSAEMEEINKRLADANAVSGSILTLALAVDPDKLVGNSK